MVIAALVLAAVAGQDAAFSGLINGFTLGADEKPAEVSTLPGSKQTIHEGPYSVAGKTSINMLPNIQPHKRMLTYA